MPRKKQLPPLAGSDAKSLQEEDLRFMQRALAIASKAKGLTSPNPTVGALITHQGKIIAEGFHHGPGKPHAEIEAIQKAKRKGFHDLSKCTLYITLEPCCTHGRTPPCTDAIIQEGFSRVVVAATDPNPKHAGRAFTILKQHGIAVKHGILAAEAQWLNRDFNHFITTGMPWMVAKYAMTLDGRLAPAPHQSRWLTSTDARAHVHLYRAHADAILIGAGTLRTDNPQLTLRGIPSHRLKRPLVPIILTRSGNLPATSRIMGRKHPAPIIYHNRSWGDILRDLGARGFMHVIIEGGPTTLASAFEAQIVHEIHLYLAPKILGTEGIIPPWPAHKTADAFIFREQTTLGNDLFIMYSCKTRCHCP
jgi:diaminohydroxyphosphoribosylaminopyrimidine deaminase/5-amino-6-(5-phosphoribosylamino)uracil reductase